MRDAVLAEFDRTDDLLRAIRSMREAGYRQLDAFTPYPSHEVEEALGMARSRLPWVCFAAALLGASAAYGLQWLLQAHLYPLNVGGRPPHFPLAFLIISFEMGVLAAGLTAFVGILVTARLPMLWHPVDEIDGFEKATDDRYWLVVTGPAPPGDRTPAEDRLRELEPRRIVALRRHGSHGSHGGMT